MPPEVRLRIDDRLAVGKGELRVGWAEPSLAQGQRNDGDLELESDLRQKVLLWGTRDLVQAEHLRTQGQRLTTSPSSSSRWPFILKYDQALEPDRRIIDFTLSGRDTSQQGVLLSFVDVGGDDPIERALAPGLRIKQIELPGHPPDVAGASALRFWLPVEITTSSGKTVLQGNSKATVAHLGATYDVEIYRSLRRSPGTDPTIPFEGEHYLLTAIIQRQ